MNEIYPSSEKVACILLATCNGADNLPDQLESILGQDTDDWILLARDDGSTDGTTEILEFYAKKDRRIRIIKDDIAAFGNPVGNFNTLVAAGLTTNSDIFFFSDQDDFWSSDKVSRQKGVLEGMDSGSASLVHHDMEVVNADLSRRHSSFFDLMKMDPSNLTFNDLLGRNEVTGCTIACNRTLLELASPFPAGIIMHDWWLALVCSAAGEMRVIDQPLVRYRQHGSNVIGAKSFWHGLNPARNIFKMWLLGNEELRATIYQAEILCQYLDDKGLLNSVPGEVRESLEAYATILSIPRFTRIRRCREHGLLKKHWFLKLMQKIRLLLFE